MTNEIGAIDWLIITVYCAALLAMAWWLSRRQFDRVD